MLWCITSNMTELTLNGYQHMILEYIFIVMCSLFVLLFFFFPKTNNNLANLLSELKTELL